MVSLRLQPLSQSMATLAVEKSWSPAAMRIIISAVPSSAAASAPLRVVKQFAVAEQRSTSPTVSTVGVPPAPAHVV